MLVTLLVVISVTFFLVRLLPGSPFDDSKLTPQQIALVNHQYGLDAPVPVQFAKYLGNIVFHGNMGTAFQWDNKPVTGIIKARIGSSAMIGAQSLVLGTIVGLGLGIISALKKNSIWDQLATIISVLGVSVPSFVFAAVLQYSLGLKAGWFPVTWGVPLGVSFRYSWTLLPSVALSFFTISTVCRFARAELVEVLGSDYIITARSKGLTGAQVIVKHAIRNALIPVITVLGPLVVSLLTGSLVIEKVFAVPGLGDLLVKAISTNDLFVISGVAIFYSALYIFSVLVVDILYGVIDPRIRLAEGGKA
jgi:oligopeptide transport system permease protein